MKTKSAKHKHFSIHQQIERFARHRLSLALVSALMFIGVASFDGRMRTLLQEAYTQGWGWIGTYMHHEHPAHLHGQYAVARIPTISGPN